MFLKEFFEKVNFEKKSADDMKSMKNYPACKEPVLEILCFQASNNGLFTKKVCTSILMGDIKKLRKSWQHTLLKLFKGTLRVLPLITIYSATLVTHHFFKAHIFWQKCWNPTFSMMIYLLTFYLFDHIEKISESLMGIILLRQVQFWQNCTCNLNIYIFYLCFALGIIHGDCCDRKTL